MIILINKQDQLLSDKYLYNALLDKLDYKNGFICPNFKNKFFMVLQSLDSNKDIKVIKINDTYRAVYSNNLESYTKNTSVFDFDYKNEFTQNYFDIKYDPLSFTEYFVSQDSTFSNLSKYKDLENGNSIYHDLVKLGSYEIIQKMFESGSMNIDIKNDLNLTPLDYVNDIRIARLFIKDLYLKNKQVNSKFDDLIIKQKEQNEENTIIKNQLNKNIIAVDAILNFVGVYIIVLSSAYVWKLFL